MEGYSRTKAILQEDDTMSESHSERILSHRE